MIVEGIVHRLGDDVDTDAILAGRYLALREPGELAAHCLEALDPGFRARVREGDILVAGRNLGQGSSREHAVIALKASGIRAIVAASVARIFFRNAINLGLPVMICPAAASALRAGVPAAVRLAGPSIRQDGQVWTPLPLGAEAGAILAAGGLIARTRALIAARQAAPLLPSV